MKVQHNKKKIIQKETDSLTMDKGRLGQTNIQTKNWKLDQIHVRIHEVYIKPWINIEYSNNH